MKIIANISVSFFLVLVIGLFCSASAGRQRLWPPLSDEDMEMMAKRARVEMTGKPIGTKLKWSNPESGNKGIVILKNRETNKEGRECREIEHVLQITRESRPRRYTFYICVQPSGEWKVE